MRQVQFRPPRAIRGPRKGLGRQLDELLEADSEPKRNFERTTVSAKACRLPNRRPQWGSKLPHKDAVKC
jgi:hypothetical protein